MGRRLGEEAALTDATPYLDLYPGLLRRVYLEQRRQVLPAADLVLSGLDQPARWVESVLAALGPAWALSSKPG